MKFIEYSRQKGIANILIILLLSLAVGATAISMVNSSRNTQTKQVAVHAATHSNNLVWSAAEAFRKYMKTSSMGNLNAMSGQSFPIEISGYDRAEIEATINDFKEDESQSNAYFVDTTISVKDGEADAASIVNLVFSVRPSTNGRPSKAENSLSIAGDLTLTGGISITGSKGSKQDIAVDGTLELNDLSVSDLKDIKATGSVLVGSTVTADSVSANGDVYITTSGYIEAIYALGNVQLSGWGKEGNVWANGRDLSESNDLSQSFSVEGININGNTSLNAAVTLRDIVFNAGEVKTSLKAGRDITVTAGSKTPKAEAGRNMIIKSEYTRVDNVYAEGDIICAEKGAEWGAYKKAYADGSTSTCTKIVAGQNVNITQMKPLDPVTVEKLDIDVWPMKSDANYILEYDEDAKLPRVTIYNINGVEDGSVFYFVNAADGGYLCKNTGTGDKCATSDLGPAFCVGNSGNDSESCSLEYSEPKDSEDALAEKQIYGSWAINGTMAPGVFWVKGSVTFGNFYSVNTFYVTGDVSGGEGSDFKLVAVNYGSFDAVCRAGNPMIDNPKTQDGTTTFDKTVLITQHYAKYHRVFADQYPTNLCDMDAQDYISFSGGNIAIKAGGRDPDGDGTYSGGDVSLGGSARVWGQILAGDMIYTSGATYIFGTVTSAALGDNRIHNGDTNVLQAYTGIRVDESDDYTGDDGHREEDGDGSNQVNIRWARYD